MKTSSKENELASIEPGRVMCGRIAQMSAVKPELGRRRSRQPIVAALCAMLAVAASAHGQQVASMDAI